jgi:hypothetical protein
MALKIGSATFSINGTPGVVASQDDVKAEYVIDTDREAVRKIHKHGYINGLSMEERVDFNKAIDDIIEIQDPKEKIDELAKVVEESRSDPKKFRMTRYLESELFHQMQINNLSPRYFKASMPLGAVARSI